MKKIINGKLYNTETTECIADEEISLHDFYKTSESLFRTKSGVWFLFGESSAGGIYCDSDGRNSSSGEDIILLEEKEVLEWAERASITSEEQEKIAKLLNIQEA